MINKPPPRKGLIIRIPIIIPMNGRGVRVWVNNGDSWGYHMAYRVLGILAKSP